MGGFCKMEESPPTPADEAMTEGRLHFTYQLGLAK